MGKLSLLHRDSDQSEMTDCEGVMSLSEEEHAALSEMETALGEEDPELARALTTFSRPNRRRWLWDALAIVLSLSVMMLVLGISLNRGVFSVLGAVLVGALSAVLSLGCVLLVRGP